MIAIATLTDAARDVLAERERQISVEALAEAWASIDGKMEAYCHERDTDMDREDPGYTGHYEGYIAEAESMIARLRTRGFDVCRVAGTHGK